MDGLMWICLCVRTMPAAYGTEKNTETHIHKHATKACQQLSHTQVITEMRGEGEGRPKSRLKHLRKATMCKDMHKIIDLNFVAFCMVKSNNHPIPYSLHSLHFAVVLSHLLKRAICSFATAKHPFYSLLRHQKYFSVLSFREREREQKKSSFKNDNERKKKTKKIMERKKNASQSEWWYCFRQTMLPFKRIYVSYYSRKWFSEFACFMPLRATRSISAIHTHTQTCTQKAPSWSSLNRWWRQ